MPHLRYLATNMQKQLELGLKSVEKDFGGRYR